MAKARRKNRHAKFLHLIGTVINWRGINYTVYLDDSRPTINRSGSQFYIADISGWKTEEEYIKEKPNEAPLHYWTWAEVKAGKRLSESERMGPPKKKTFEELSRPSRRRIPKRKRRSK